MKLYTLSTSPRQTRVIPQMAEGILASRKRLNSASRVAGVSAKIVGDAIRRTAAAFKASQGQVVLDELEMRGLLAVLTAGDIQGACQTLKLPTLGCGQYVNTLLAQWPADWH